MFKNRTRIMRLTMFALILAVIGGGIIWVYVEDKTSQVNVAFAQGSGDLSSINLPEGFEIDYFARDIAGARSLTLGENGTLFVGTRRSEVYAIPNATETTEAEAIITLTQGTMSSPNGVAVVDGDLYVAEISRVWRFDDIEATLNSAPQPQLVTDALPREGHHGWKFMAQGPDGKLYFNVGAPCNICELEGLFGSITRMNLDGSGIEVYATGVRNSVGFDWHPETGELWFTNNGRDWMGDDLPPDTLHRATAIGQHFGFPYCHGGDIPDPDFGSRRSCDEFVPPEANLGPHVAALGMRFYTGEMFPDEYRNQILIAEHGSWNRTVPIGYRVTLIRLDENQAVTSYEPFAEGWLNEQTQQAWGRPADVLVMPDGAVLVSDDGNNAIYRISYSG